MVKRYARAHFICYSNAAAPFRENGDNYCAAALRAGFDTATHYKAEDLQQTEFWQANAGILEQPRGAGYWLWKPYITLDKLRQVGPDDVVVYNDVGRYKPGSFSPFPRFPQAAVNMTALLPNRYLFGFIADWLVQGHYTKRDCFIGLDADTEEMHLAHQVSGGPIFAMPGAASFAFLEDWLRHAQDPRLLTDIPDEMGPPLKEFEDHRHDMAISSILLHQRRGNYLDLTKSAGFTHAEDVRRRNRHVPRAQTHAGYFSLMLERALPDDFFMREAPDLAEAAQIVRNITPDQPIPTQDRTIPRPILTEEVDRMLEDGRLALSQDHLIALLSENRIFAAKIHALTKLPDDQVQPFWAEARRAVTEAAEGLPPGQTPDPAQIASEALQSAETAFPALQTEMMVHLVWGALNDDARGLFKAQHRNVKAAKGRAAMETFLAHHGTDGVLPPDIAQSGKSAAFSDHVSALLVAWLVSDAAETEKS